MNKFFIQEIEREFLLASMSTIHFSIFKYILLQFCRHVFNEVNTLVYLCFLNNEDDTMIFFSFLKIYYTLCKNLLRNLHGWFLDVIIIQYYLFLVININDFANGYFRCKFNFACFFRDPYPHLLLPQLLHSKFILIRFLIFYKHKIVNFLLCNKKYIFHQMINYFS